MAIPEHSVVDTEVQDMDVTLVASTERGSMCGARRTSSMHGARTM